MTDRIDLDDLETGDDEEQAEGNYGDWLWRDDDPADPSNEPESPWSGASSANDARKRETERDDADEATTDEATTDESAAEPDRTPAPHVPQTGDRTPVGLPTDGSDDGSAGSGSSSSAANAPESEPLRPLGAGATTDAEAGDGSTSAAASGPHGGGADDMTMAITFRALRRLEHPAAVFASAYEWSDWVGIVGDVPAHVVQKFQRDRGIDVDFFNGSGTGPGERLAEIDRNSMFYADRMVVVGVEGADEPIAEAADWEFVDLETAAEKADWKLESDSS